MVLKWQPWKLKSSIKLQNLHSMDENSANFCHTIPLKCLKVNLEKLFLVVTTLQPQCLVISYYFQYNRQQVYGLSWWLYTADRSWAKHFQHNYFLSEKNSAVKSEVFWEKEIPAQFSKGSFWNKMFCFVFTYFIYISLEFHIAIRNIIIIYVIQLMPSNRFCLKWSTLSYQI